MVLVNGDQYQKIHLLSKLQPILRFFNHPIIYDFFFAALCDDCDHGHCISPSECVCHLGWMGDTCSQCVEHPNCVMGRCVDHPMECICFDGFDGPNCEHTVCRDGCHPEHVIFQLTLKYSKNRIKQTEDIRIHCFPPNLFFVGKLTQSRSNLSMKRCRGGKILIKFV